MKYFLIIYIAILSTTSVLGQEPIKMKCGEIIESSFTKPTQVISYSINLEGGDKLKLFNKGKYGEILKMCYGIYGPSGTAIRETFGTGNNNWKNLNEFTTPILPATGTYKIYVYNYYYRYPTSSQKGSLGDFILELSCIKQDGKVIEYGEIEEENQKEQKETLPSSILKIPIGTPIEGSISPNSNDNYAFKTSFEKGKPIEIKIEILKGNTPIKITITNELSKTVVFNSTLKYSKSMKNTMVFPEDGNYIILMTEDGINNLSNRRTDFKVTLSKE